MTGDWLVSYRVVEEGRENTDICNSRCDADFDT